MDWTWHLDGFVPALLLVGALLGGLAAGMGWLAGTLWLLWVPKARVALALALATSGSLALVGHEDAAVLTTSLTVLAALGAGAIVAVRAVRRRVVSPLLRAAAVAVLVLLWDATHTAMGAWLILPAAGLFYLLAAATEALQRKWASSRVQLGVAAVMIVATVGSAGWSRLNIKLANDRAPVVIAACRRFESDQGRLPHSLDELVPNYLPEVPCANWTLLGAFSYDPDPGVLSYLDPWPFERTYLFSSDEWDFDRPYGSVPDFSPRRKPRSARIEPAAAFLQHEPVSSNERR